MPTPRPVAFVSRQRLVGRTNGSSISAEPGGYFVRGVVTLAQNEGRRRELGEKALAVAQAHFSADAAQGRFVAWLRTRDEDL